MRSTGHATTSAGELPERLVEQYNVVDRIGSGSHATVYRGTSRTDLSLRVAIKVLHLPVVDDARRARFDREVAALRRVIDCPNVVRLIEAGVDDDGRAYLVTPLYAGTLADRLGSIGPLHADEVVSCSIDVARALDAAHQHGVVHRDVKPANIFLDSSGRAVLGDFGTAGLVDAQTASGSLAMSIAYAAPETLEDGSVTPASDLYSLGATMHHLLTGRLPFGGATTSGNDVAGVGALVRRVVEQDPEPIDDSTVPPSLRRIVATLMAKRPADRPVDAHTVSALLDQVPPAEAQSEAGRISTQQHGRPISSARMVLAIVSVLVVIGLAAVVLFGRNDDAPLDVASAQPEAETQSSAAAESGVDAEPGAEAESAVEVEPGAEVEPAAETQSRAAAQAGVDEESATETQSSVAAEPAAERESATCRDDVALLLCDDFDGAVDWTDLSNRQMAIVEPIDAVSVSGDRSLAVLAADVEPAGGSWWERSIVIPDDATSLSVSLSVYAEGTETAGFWVNFVSLVDSDGRQWRLDLMSAGDGEITFDALTEGPGDEAIVTGVERSFPADRWLCVEFDLTPGGATAGALRVDGAPVGSVEAISTEQGNTIGADYQVFVGAIRMSDPAETPNIFLDDLTVSADGPIGCA